jgi:sulfide:quinone oxidoreductase
MKRLVILGAGTSGTMMVNHLHKKIDRKEWAITILDQYPKHYYQPGFLFIPFGIYSESDVIKPKKEFIPDDVEYIETKVDRIDKDKNAVIFESCESLEYDILIIATGSKTAPEETEGLMGDDWRTRVFDFYTIEGAKALHDALERWQGGRMVVHITEMPIKCPVAPLEFTFLADWWLSERGLRDKTELTYVTPLSGAFTKPLCADVMSGTLVGKGINVITDFNIGRVDNERHTIVSWDEREVPYDLLVTIPTNKGDAVIERSGFGDELNFVPTDKNTLQSKVKENIFVIGDATDAPASKAGSVAHFEAEVLTKNILHYMNGEPLEAEFDGHANCYIESGYNKAFLIDFNYDLQPVPGKYPLPGIGPFSLLKESHMNHLGKMAFRWIYWNMLLKAKPMPGIGYKMQMAGKHIPESLLPTPAQKTSELQTN